MTASLGGLVSGLPGFGTMLIGALVLVGAAMIGSAVLMIRVGAPFATALVAIILIGSAPGGSLCAMYALMS